MLSKKRFYGILNMEKHQNISTKQTEQNKNDQRKQAKQNRTNKTNKTKLEQTKIKLNETNKNKDSK